MEFTTIKENIETKLTEKKSKFIANLIYINSKEDAENKIKELKKKYYDARHNCIAYRVIDENNNIIEKSSDDGEPSGTAGAPMLNILQKNNLCNVLVVVTRYFGGILLGTGGLVRCYSQVTIDAIELSEKVEMQDGVELEVALEYSSFELFKVYCNKRNISIININYDEKIICNIEMKKENKKCFLEDIEKQKVKLLENKEIRSKFIKKK